MKNHDLKFLQSELSRVSDWIKFADAKAGFIAVFYSAIFGFLWTQKEDILAHIFNGTGIYVVFYPVVVVAILLLIPAGIYFLYATICPQLKNGNTDRSLFYFGNVAKMKIEDYLKDVEKMTEDEACRQIAEQIYTNSVIANAKMGSVRKSTQVLVAVGILLLVFILL